MARFYPVYARRSDGKQEVVGKGRRKEMNQPTDDQLDQKPDKNGIADFYREVLPDEQKHIDWRRKLGGMLARELQAQDTSGGGEYVVDQMDRLRVSRADGATETGYLLVALPENYRLFEHVKKTEQNGKTELKNKTHTGGQNDRQDAYLYGHPAGRKKRFRSPNDFFPHLLWLSTDESGDPDNCSCKICSPEELENIVPGAKTRVERPGRTDAESPALVAARPVSGQGVKAPSQGHRPPQSQPPPTQHQSPSQQHPQPQPQLQPQRPTPTPLPPAKTQNQSLDRTYGNFMYRAGELVWFSRGQAWGIGVVTRRWAHTETSCYSIQPLSYPGNTPQLTVKQGHKEIRPWLAWSVPRFLNVALNDQPNPPRYESADWQGIMQKKYGNGDLEVDGSIMAAKMVDAAYTLIDKNSNTRPEPNVVETRYDGMFLGAEKIWCGEPVRLQIGSGTDTAVITAIVERQRLSPANQQVTQQAVYLVGDIYSLATIQHNNPTIPSPADTNPHLPERMVKDLRIRNAQSIKTRRIASYWKLMSAQQRIDLHDIKGRWYEASIIMPILHPQIWVNALTKGEVQEASLWMNSRSDCLNSNRDDKLPRIPRENNRKASRRDAFGHSIPPGTTIEDGVQPPVPDNVDPGLSAAAAAGPMDHHIEIDPRFETADGAGNANHPVGVDSGTTGLEEFMDLDGGFGEVGDFVGGVHHHDANHGFF